jgi:hypothetical protein
MKKSKSEVDYSKGMKSSHCGPLSLYDKGFCRHFAGGKSWLHGLGTCELVSGSIDKEYWCKLFEKGHRNE